jgi:hypothetical protein
MYVDHYIPVLNSRPNRGGVTGDGGNYQGGITQMFAGTDFDPGLRRPYIAEKGKYKGQVCVTAHTGDFTVNCGQRVPIRRQTPIRELILNGVVPPTLNATALRKEEWIRLDTRIERAARFRLQAWADLSSANSYGGFNGMSKKILEYEAMSDPGEALMDMDALTEGRTDQPNFQLQGVPLAITHSDFWYDSRTLAISRNSGTPLDVTSGEAAGRRVAESIEKTLLGVYNGITYGGNSTQIGGYGRPSTIYGYTNFPARLTTTSMYRPTGNGRSGSGWVAGDTVKDVLAMLDLLKFNRFYGPFMVYVSNDWQQYLDGDYILTGGNVATQTLRERLKAIPKISDVKDLDFLFASQLTGPGSDATNLFPFTMLFVQMTSDVCEAVNGMDITTLQWESMGGLRVNFKIMCINVPRLKADFYGRCGILHATATL